MLRLHNFGLLTNIPLLPGLMLIFRETTQEEEAYCRFFALVQSPAMCRAIFLYVKLIDRG